MDIGKKISLLRKNKGLKQKELADILHVTDKAISRWESGIGNPDVTMLPQIAKVFDVSLDYLLSDEEGLPQPKNEEKTVEEIKTKNKPNRKVITIIVSSIFALVLVIACVIGIPLIVKDTNLKKSYLQAIDYMESGQYVEAKTIFDGLEYKDSKSKAIVCNGLITLLDAKSTKNSNTLALGVQFVVTGGSNINVHYDGNGKYIIDNQIRYDDVLTKENFTFLVPSSEGFDKWINQSFYYYKEVTFLYLSAVWR